MKKVTEGEYCAYLFVYFTGEKENGEQIYFSVSRDGLHWEDLNQGSPVIVSKVCEKGVRDPYILRNEIDNRFYIISTDLRIAGGKGWDAAQSEGSRNIMVCSSGNLTEWSEIYPVNVGVEGAGCVWAPEAIYDVKEGNFLVYWASMIQLNGDVKPKHRIYSARTKDFRSFTKPEIYMERNNHVIDTTIIEYNGEYYRFSKDETDKCIIAERGRNVGSRDFEEIAAPEVNNIMGVEGPAIFKFNDREEWCLIVDRFAKNKGYLPIVTHDIASGKFRVLDDSEYDMGKAMKRHGSVLNITDREYGSLVEKYGK